MFTNDGVKMVSIKKSVSLERIIEARDEWLTLEEKGKKLNMELTGQNYDYLDINDIVREIKNRLYEDKIQPKRIR